MNIRPIPQSAAVLNEATTDGNVVAIPPCPECTKEGKQTSFKSTAERGRHRRKEHGIPGSSPTSLALRRKREKKSSLTIGAHPELKPGYESGDNANASSMTEQALYSKGLAVGHALGRVQALLTDHATRSGILRRNSLGRSLDYFSCKCQLKDETSFTPQLGFGGPGSGTG